jgi:hypothetical protein
MCKEKKGLFQVRITLLREAGGRAATGRLLENRA